MTDYTSTAADRAAYADIVAAAYEFPAGSPEWTRYQHLAADQIVSCYTGCDGEREHEQRRDGSCRCGKYTARPEPWYIAVDYTYEGGSFVQTFAPLAASLSAARNLARAEFIRTHMDGVEITGVRVY